MSFEGVQPLAGGRVPELHELVVPRGGGELAIAGQGQAFNGLGRTFESAEDLLRGRVVQLDDFSSGGSKDFAVGRSGEAVSFVVLFVIERRFLTRGHVPTSKAAITSGEYHLVVRPKSDRFYPSQSILEPFQLFTGDNVPKPGRLI